MLKSYPNNRDNKMLDPIKEAIEKADLLTAVTTGQDLTAEQWERFNSLQQQARGTK